MFVFFVYKMFFYSQCIGRFPDEIEHVSYIATLETDNAIIPDFKSMKILQLVPSAPLIKNNDGILTEAFTFGKSFNYLGHPPLYYQIMRLSGGVTVHN
jgi:hypothetical protein